MENEVIRVKKRERYGIVSDSLIEDRRLTPTARLVGAWFEGRPVNWEIRRRHLIETLGISLKTWWSARKELIEFGYLTHVRVRKSGRFVGSEIEFQIPTPGPGLKKQNCTNPMPMRVPTTHPLTMRGETTHGEGECLALQGLPPVLKTPPPQPPARVVVVVNGNEGESREAKQPVDHDDDEPGQPLHWPPGLTVKQQVDMQTALAPLGLAAAQELLDELAGRMASATPVRNPHGLLRHLVELQKDGTLVCELADEVRAIRDARVAHKMRQERFSLVKGGEAPPAQGNAASAETQAVRAALRAARRPGGKWA